MKEVVYRNRIEMKIFFIVYAIVGIPSFISLVISLFESPENIVVFIVFPIFALPLYIVSRFRIVFDFKNDIIYHTGYISKRKTYKLSNIKIIRVMSKTTVPNDYVFNFYNEQNLIFKIGSLDWEGQTKESVDILKSLFSDESKFIWDLESKLRISDGYLGVYFYQLCEKIAVAYLSNDVSIIFGFDEMRDKFLLNVLKNNNWDEQLEVVEVSEMNLVFDEFQNLIVKYDSQV